MKRQHPFITTIGFLITLAFLAVLGTSLWTHGGKAFSPGGLSAEGRSELTLKGFRSHAEFEEQCVLCHDPLKTDQVTLCLACHEDIAAEIEGGIGTHGLAQDAGRCAVCHSDHRGRDFDMIASAYPQFDHEVLHFSLLRHQVGYDAALLECHACHAPEDFAVSDATCQRCHGKHDAPFMVQHAQDYGEACLVCHDGRDTMVAFDHQATRFPLDGHHAEVRCADCHHLDVSPRTEMVATSAGSPQSSPFEGMPLECAGCHEEPEIHKGLYPEPCEGCHTTTGWLPAIIEGDLFAHTVEAGFSLARHEVDFAGAAISCTACHQPDHEKVTMQACTTCHVQVPDGELFMREHQVRFGGECLQCHDGVDRMSDFDHARFFPLDGRHAELECAACHADRQFAGTPEECVHCHTEPEIHAGFFGVQCQYCHTSLAWTPAQLRLHTFPLDHGGEGEVACQVCHTASYDQNTCYGCHEHQPEAIAAGHREAGISAQELPNCTACHPTGLEKAEDGQDG